MGYFIAPRGFLKANIEDHGNELFSQVLLRAFVSVCQLNTSNISEVATILNFAVYSFIAHTLDRLERLLCKIIMSFKKKYARRHVLKCEKSLSSDRFFLLSFVH